mmetsp:Transcript_1878/g.7535  ORF Transcript_1878/g.7535 Transcript_1878/m.7535 type:complete len:285 (+) Transcript_1878:659-1513(+)
MAERQQLWQRSPRDDSDSTNARPGDDARPPHARLLLASAEEKEITGEASDHGSVAFSQMESAGATDTTRKQLRASEQLQTPATNGDPAAPSRRACAPTYFIVGARKGGTTALFRLLLEAAPGAVIATPELLREGDTPGARSPRAEALAGETGFFARPRTIVAARAQLRAHGGHGADSHPNRARRSRPLANSETKARDELQRLVRECNGHWFPAEVFIYSRSALRADFATSRFALRSALRLLYFSRVALIIAGAIVSITLTLWPLFFAARIHSATSAMQALFSTR